MNYKKLQLSHIFGEEVLNKLNHDNIQTLTILNYFATSLFDKKTINEVVWDVTKNCISKLNLEDCIIYLIDESNTNLIQTAAFGNKNNAEQEIVSPVIISIGDGIVGHVAATGTPELVNDITKDSRYILDDKQRYSELTVPIFLEKKIIGVIDSEHTQKNFFSEYHLNQFRLVAQLLEKKITPITQNKKKCFTKDNIYYKDFLCLLNNEKIYKEQNINLSLIAKKLGISANYLSQLINKLSNHSFSKFINKYRIEEVCKLVKNSEYNHYTLAGIGLECGFKSKSTFYKSFKMIKGVTPKEFKKTF